MQTEYCFKCAQVGHLSQDCTIWTGSKGTTPTYISWSTTAIATTTLTLEAYWNESSPSQGRMTLQEQSSEVFESKVVKTLSPTCDSFEDYQTHYERHLKKTMDWEEDQSQFTTWSQNRQTETSNTYSFQSDGKGNTTKETPSLEQKSIVNRDPRVNAAIAARIAPTNNIKITAPAAAIISTGEIRRNGNPPSHENVKGRNNAFITERNTTGHNGQHSAHSGHDNQPHHQLATH